jgi:hypothetical protein
MPGRLRLRYRNAGPAVEEIQASAGWRLREDLRIREDLRVGPPPVRGQRAVVATLPNGRVLWLRLPKAIAPLGQVNWALERLRRHSHRREVELRARQADLIRLSREALEGTKRLARARQEAHRKLGRRIVALTSGLDRRLSRKLARRTTEIEQQAKRQRVALGRLRRRILWDNLVLVSAVLLMARFRQQGKVLGANNIAIAILTMVWILGDDITDLLAGSRPDPRYGIRDVDFWSYIAPYANLLTGWLLLRFSQIERFVTGFADELEPVGESRGALLSTGAQEQIFEFAQTIDLEPFVASDHFPDFEGFTEVPAVASTAHVAFTDTALAAGASLRSVGADVADGELVITATVAIPAPPSALFRDPSTILDKLSIAWIVDTDKHAEA